MYVVLAKDDGKPVEWKEFQRDGPTVIQRVPITEYLVPKEATFNLLGEIEPDLTKPSTITLRKPVAHYKNKIHVAILTDNLSMGQKDMPPELAHHIRVTPTKKFLPILYNDVLKCRMRDLEEITKNTTTVNLEFNISPISIGKLRLFIHIENALGQLSLLGFSKKDIEEVKGIFSDTNVYLLCGTIFIGSIHSLFDFLSFKNDVIFWKRKR